MCCVFSTFIKVKPVKRLASLLSFLTFEPRRLMYYLNCTCKKFRGLGLSTNDFVTLDSTYNLKSA